MPTGGSGRVRSTSEKIWEFLLHVFLILIVVSIILPFWFTLVSSFEKVETIGVRFWPERLRWIRIRPCWSAPCWEPQPSTQWPER